MSGVFVTVGTTKFDELVSVVRSNELQQELLSQGFSQLVIQYGRGQAPSTESVSGLHVEQFDLRPSIQTYFQNADLVISHGGSGSILEALREGKKLIVVINRALMDDHQTELAEELAKQNYLIYTDADGLLGALQQGEWKSLTPLPVAPERNPFMDQLDKHLGVN